MSEKNNITVIGCGVGSDNLPPEALKVLAAADVIVGGRRLLADFAEEYSCEKVVLGADAKDVVRRLVAEDKGRKIAILASGDALFFGIAGTLSRSAEPGSFSVIPNITAFQYFCAKIAEPWSDYSLFTIHGRKEPVPWHQILSAKCAIIYCDRRMSADKLAAHLIEMFPEALGRPAAACADLGMDSEVIRKGTLGEIAKFSFSGLSILMLKSDEKINSYPPLRLGLPDEQYAHERNLITHPEVRAVALSKLSLRGGVLWDLGACSGSVGIEAAGLIDTLSVYAVEKNSARIADIEKNAKFAGVQNFNILESDIISALPELPDPDSVFIGGGGKDIKEIAEATFARVNSGGCMVVSAVTLDTVAILQGILQDALEEVVSLSVSRSKNVADLTMMKAENTIYLFVFRK